MMVHLEVGEAVPALTLLRTDGSEVGLDELTAGRPAVLHFVRHYG